MTSSISMNLRVAVAATLLAAAAIASAQQASPFAWQTVANNKSCIPDDPKGRTFNSYGQPSVNASGLVVFRGRSTGSEGGGGEGVVSSVCDKFSAPANGPARGVYKRDMGEGLDLREFAAVHDSVPDPNNTNYNELPAPFNEFPAFPRMDVTSDAIATRGQSRPVWTYPTGEFLVDEETGVSTPVTTRVGTSGIYVDRMPELGLTTGVGQLAVALVLDGNDVAIPDPDMARFAVPVPQLAVRTRFDQFPGSPAVMQGSVIAFKGNFTDTRGTVDTADDAGFTGVFIRDVIASDGMAPVQLVASSRATEIPGTKLLFGSTAPPSAASGYVWFVGSDNEESPTRGGIYRSAVKEPSKIIPMVKIGEPVNGFSQRFSKIGESLSLNAKGTQTTFWAAWGTETAAVQLKCPTDGKLAAECLTQNDKDADGNDLGYHTMLLPRNQGIFVYDTGTKNVVPVATTADGGGFEQFLYCIFSGKPQNIGQGSEGSGGEDAGGGSEEGDGGANEEPGADGEPARWRCSSFAALSGMSASPYQVAFKATKSGGETGVYLWDSGSKLTKPVLKVGDPGTWLEPTFGSDSNGVAMQVTAIGIERDGFRNGWLGITASMANADASESMAGVYVTRVPGWAE